MNSNGSSSASLADKVIFTGVSWLVVIGMIFANGTWLVGAAGVGELTGFTVTCTLSSEL